MATRLSKRQMTAYSKLLKKLGKRPRAVLEAILKNGSVSTYDLGEMGYDQPPRAAQDLKEAGVQLRTTSGKHPATGARMAIYDLDPMAPVPSKTSSGRRALPKEFCKAIREQSDFRCNVCKEQFEASRLQVDHRVPYIVAGETAELRREQFQVLCWPHQRLKSWSCEHCPNREDADATVCTSCYWAIPDGEYEHVAMVAERRADLTWRGEKEIGHYKALSQIAEQEKISIPLVIKRILQESLNKG